MKKVHVPPPPTKFGPTRTSQAKHAPGMLVKTAAPIPPTRVTPPPHTQFASRTTQSKSGGLSALATTKGAHLAANMKQSYGTAVSTLNHANRQMQNPSLAASSKDVIQPAWPTWRRLSQSFRQSSINYIKANTVKRTSYPLLLQIRYGEFDQETKDMFFKIGQDIASVGMGQQTPEIASMKAFLRIHASSPSRTGFVTPSAKLARYWLGILNNSDLLQETKKDDDKNPPRFL